MWGRLFLGLVLAVALVAGYPYAALLLNRIIGTNTVVFTERARAVDSIPKELSAPVITVGTRLHPRIPGIAAAQFDDQVDATTQYLDWICTNPVEQYH